MAVSFKVPKSPQRSIFTIDEFAGVDLTNTGSNIDEVRSPNAENMIRYVPGKVRKRMGYSVPVEFSVGKDVNRAINSLDEYVDCQWDSNNEESFNIYDDHIDKVYIHLYVKAAGSYSLHVVAKDNTYVHGEFSGTVDEPYENGRLSYGYDMSTNGGFYCIKIVHLSSDSDDYCQVKGLRICHDTKAGSREEWIATPWTPAPEDSNRVFVLTTSTEPIYGRHVLKTGKKQGDFVTNVNRALGTSATYQTFWDRVICKTGESIPKDRHMHIYFDYEDANNTVLYSGRIGYDEQAITTLNGNGTCIRDFIASNNFNYLSVSDTSIKIKNMFLAYAVKSPYTWSAAPEDQGAVFEIGDVYQRTGDNTAIFSSKSEKQLVHGASEPATQWFYPTVAIQQSTTAITNKLTVIDFDVSLDMNNGSGTHYTIDKFITWFKGSDNHTYSFDWTNGQPSNMHFTFFIMPNSGTFIKDLGFTVGTTTSISGTAAFCDISIKNLTVYEGVEKTDFWSPAYINIYHVGQKLYANKSGEDTYDLIYSNMNQHRSLSWQFEAHDNSSEPLGYDNLYIVDGRNFLEYNGAAETIDAVNNNGRIPWITAAKSPSGGGTSLDAINRLQPGFEETFIGDGSSVNYQLSFTNLDNTPVRVWILDRNDAVWMEKAEGTDFTVNTGLGVITFLTAPWDNTSAGEDNVKIRAFRTVARYSDSINKCTFGTLFGIGGTSDRLFLSGNPDYPNYDFFSEQYDPTYFPDVNYATLGVSSSEIKGYARVNNYLATFKDENEPSQSVFIREGDLIVDSNNLSQPAFKLINTLQGNGAISPYTFGYLQTEPLFLTKSGIFAITAQDITGEKYGQARSFYVNGELLKERDLENACAVVYNDMYILALNGHLYCLDGLQPTRTDPQMPYATRQYVAYYCTGINANVMWTYNDALWFGTSDGKVCKFYTDMEDLESYNDDGKAIYCCWETPDLSGKLFYKNKTFRYFTIRMMKALKTSVKMYAMKHGVWSDDPVKEDTLTGLTFDFENIDFTRFTFSTDRSEKVVHTKIRIKKVDKARFKVENDALNEPFGLFDLALEYIESGNYKG